MILRFGYFLSTLAALLIVCSLSIGAEVSLAEDSTALEMISTYRYFDRPIDPDLYLVRPGDVLKVTFINAGLNPLKLTVDPEGNIINSALAINKVAGKTLSQVRLMLRDELSALYNADQIVISISNPARVTISVTGAVRCPGLYTAEVSQRVSEIIDSAGGVIALGSRRWIIFSGGSKEIIVDLDRAKFIGDVDSDPCLYAGYSVYVPSKSTDRVQVVGEVNIPREIELTPGDNLDILLALAGGLRSSGDRVALQVIRNAEPLNAENIRLAPGDIIIVPPLINAPGFDDIVLYGAVKNPGRYSYITGITLPKFIETAGGFTENAGWGRTVLFRKAQADARGRYSTVRYPISCKTSDHKGLSDISLQPSDSVFVPPAMGYVRVRGAVYNQGYFMFVEGEDALFYIMSAGGYLPSADKDLIGIYNHISGVTETLRPKVLINDGDEVVVRIREELQ